MGGGCRWVRGNISHYGAPIFRLTFFLAIELNDRHLPFLEGRGYVDEKGKIMVWVMFHNSRRRAPASCFEWSEKQNSCGIGWGALWPPPKGGEQPRKFLKIFENFLNLETPKTSTRNANLRLESALWLSFLGSLDGKLKKSIRKNFKERKKYITNNFK